MKVHAPATRNLKTAPKPPSSKPGSQSSRPPTTEKPSAQSEHQAFSTKELPDLDCNRTTPRTPETDRQTDRPDGQNRRTDRQTDRQTDRRGDKEADAVWVSCPSAASGRLPALWPAQTTGPAPGAHTPKPKTSPKS